ncbi:MAG: hypothetical protein GWM87_13945 [Xanthomonadales bacterium]|nr:isoprenylcysteine carboxylmethyltransferase family protein [Xanthomonadales bacterium]NIS44202.1 isoprenylcysteine carboxylmethyltransferase family protein [Desulfuromonadales bacterium]NIX13914.1 hypothetical protein [Xanthomonadales bacterium]
MKIRERWIDYLYRSATGTREYRNSRTPVGLAIFGLFTALFVVLAIVADRVLDLPWPVPGEFSRAAAVFLIVVGVAITAWTVICFRSTRGTPVPINPPPVLIVEGPYRYARNPMLTGVFLTMFGLGFAMHSISLVLVFTPLYALAHVWEVKQIEEPELVRRFGKEFLAYRDRTPMFVPRIRVRG